MSARFVVVRHGETHWNVASRIQGHADSPLTALGEAQAAAIAGRLAQERFDVLYSSDLGRARQTAQFIADSSGLPIRTDARLRERNFGVGEGLTYGEIDVHYPDVFSRIRDTDPDYVIPGGESRRQFYDRVREAFDGLARESEGRQVAVVCHGGVLANLYRHVHGIPVTASHPVPIPNASYNALLWEAGRWIEETWGDTAHLPGTVAFVEP